MLIVSTAAARGERVSGLSARAYANVQRVSLTWEARRPEPEAYLVERSTEGGVFQRVAIVQSPANGCNDVHDLQPGTKYVYRVKGWSKGRGWEPSEMAEVTTSDFRAFDAMRFEAKPNLASVGLEQLYVVYDSELLPTPEKGNPNEVVIRRIAREASARRQVLVINVEHWPVDIRSATDQEVGRSIARLRTIAGWVRNERPDVKFGFFGILPIRDYWTPYLYRTGVKRAPTDAWWAERLPAYAQSFKEWERANDRVAELADRVDYTFPDLYTFHDDRDGWQVFAMANLDAAKRYGKPVFPFLWMDYHYGEERLRNIPLRAEDWRLELDLVRTNAQGLVIWGGWKFPRGLPAYRVPWDASLAWWDVTRRFVEVE
jgi:hypothetical protein